MRYMLSVAPRAGVFPCLYLRLCCNQAGEQARLPGQRPKPTAALARAKGKSPGPAWPAAAGTRHTAFRPAPQGQLAEPLPTATTATNTPAATTAATATSAPITTTVTTATTATNALTPPTTANAPAAPNATNTPNATSVTNTPSATTSSPGPGCPEPPLLCRGMSGMREKSLCFREEEGQTEKEIL